MRTSSLTSALTFLLASASASQPNYAPYLPPILEKILDPASDGSFVNPGRMGLSKRQNTCPGNYSPCSALTASSACCTAGTTCQLDQAGHVACCPSGSACTGTINVGTQSVSSTSGSTNGLLLGGTTTTTSGSSTISGTNGLIGPLATSATTSSNQVSQQGSIVAPSTVSNQYFAFAALPTSFSNAALCSSGYSSCQNQYQQCTASLGGGANGVTVSAPGAGVTVTGGSVTLGPSATSVCQSLSSQACHGLVLASCSTFGVGGSLATPNAAPMPGSPLYGIGVGVALGVAGQVYC